MKKRMEETVISVMEETVISYLLGCDYERNFRYIFKLTCTRAVLTIHLYVNILCSHHRAANHCLAIADIFWSKDDQALQMQTS